MGNTFKITESNVKPNTATTKRSNYKYASFFNVCCSLFATLDAFLRCKWKTDFCVRHSKVVSMTIKGFVDESLELSFDTIHFLNLKKVKYGGKKKSITLLSS